MTGPSLRRSFLSLPRQELVLVLLACACTATLSGCITFEGNRAVVPLFEIYEGPAATGGPGRPAALDENWKPPKSQEYVFRPFGSFEFIGEERRRLKSLWPVVDFAWGAGNERFWVFPLFYLRDKPIPNTEDSDLDWMVFPLFFGGSDPKEGGYFAFFPVGGVLKGLIAKDEIHFALFPIYWRAWHGEWDSLHVLWPFFNRASGGGRTGWRVWPFYGRYRAETRDGRPRYDRGFVFWPFFIRQKNNLETARPIELFFTFPFYGHSISPRTEIRTYLWPIFHVARDVETGQKLYFGYLIPYRFTGGQFDLWPFFGWKTRTYGDEIGAWDPRGLAGPGGLVGLDTEPPAESSRTRFRQFALWPIQRYDTSEGDTWARTRFWFLPLLWHFHTLRKDTSEITSEWKFWPLFRSRREGAVRTFYFPSPLFFRQENPFERQYARLWRLFLYKNTPERSGWEFLYGLFSYRSEKEEKRRIYSILYGLLETEVHPEGARFRIFWLPWR